MTSIIQVIKKGSTVYFQTGPNTYIGFSDCLDNYNLKECYRAVSNGDIFLKSTLFELFDELSDVEGEIVEITAYVEDLIDNE